MRRRWRRSAATRFPAARTTSPSRPTAGCGSRGAAPRRWRCSIRRPATYQTIEVGRSPHGLFLNPKGSVAAECRGALSHGRSVRPRRRLAAGAPADPAALRARADAVGGRVVRLGAVRGVWRRARWRSPSRSACRWSAGARWSAGRTRSAVAVDVLYTVISRVGMLPLFTFVLFYRAQVALNGFLDRPRLGAADAGAAVAVPARPAGADLRAATRSSWIAPITGGTGCRTCSAGGGRCTRCTTRSGR